MPQTSVLIGTVRFLRVVESQRIDIKDNGMYAGSTGVPEA